MRNLAIIFLLFSLSANAQIVNRFRDSTWFAKGVRFDSAIYLIKGAGNGKVLTSDGNGRATWQTFSSSGVSQGTLNDSILSVRNIRKADTVYKKSTNRDLTYYKINGVEYSFKDSSGVSLSALNDSIARVDSTINNMTFPYIPLSGTASGSPVTGDIEINTSVGGDTRKFYQTQGVGELSLQLNNDEHFISLYNSEAITGEETYIKMNNKYFLFYTDNASSRGIVGFQDYTANITDLDYTQKKYVDTHIADTANVLRGLIPNVSSYATITNLKDSTALVRGLITSSIPTFSLSKSTNRDSIVTIFNGTRTAVKDSLPTVSATSTTTFTNKRITARVDSTTSSATPTINTDNVDTYMLTAQAVNITSFTTNLSGTPTNDQILHIVIKGTGARTLSWGSSFEASTVALPTTTVSTDRLDVYFIWNTFTNKWRCGGVW